MVPRPHRVRQPSAQLQVGLHSDRPAGREYRGGFHRARLRRVRTRRGSRRRRNFPL